MGQIRVGGTDVNMQYRTAERMQGLRPSLCDDARLEAGALRPEATAATPHPPFRMAQNYLPIKMLVATGPGQPSCVAVSPDGRLLATAVHDQHSTGAALLLFSAEGLEPRMRIATDLPGFKR